MKDIAIYGYGGFGHEVACLIQHINKIQPTWNIVGYFDDGVANGSCCKYGKVLGDIHTLNAWNQPLSVVIAIGTVKYLEEIPNKITNPLVEFPNLVDPNCFFFDKESVVMGKGNIITFGCRMSCNIHIGNFNILNGCVSFGHDVVLGNYNVLFPETRISGQVSIGNRNFFGARTFAAQTIKIGNDNRFGAGSFILRKIKDGGLYMGNPAKKVSIE